MLYPITLESWPRAIAHIDGDAFFASVEQALNPKLMGKPVIVGAERGIVAAASYEAKAMGIKRGMPLSQVTYTCPECALLPGDYESYSLFSKRMFSIMRRYTPEVEEYSIDEAFLDLTGTRRLHHTGYKEICAMIQRDIHTELGITVSAGLSLSKSLAKLCSNFRKPNGLTAVQGRHIHLLLARTPIEKIWGFGNASCALLSKYGIKNALEFVERPMEFAERLLGKVGENIWMDLRGEYQMQLDLSEDKKQASISKFKTFTPPTSDRATLCARALRNLEGACIKARRYDQAAKRVILTLRGQDFTSEGKEIKLSRQSACPTELTSIIIKAFDEIFKPGKLYRATGIVLADLTDNSPVQFDVFEDPKEVLNHRDAFAAVDRVNEKFGKHTVFISEGLRIPVQHEGLRSRIPRRKTDHIRGEPPRQRIGLPMLH